MKEIVAMEARIEALEAGTERLKRRVEHLELEYLGAAGSSSPEIDQPGSNPTLMEKDELMDQLCGASSARQVWLSLIDSHLSLSLTGNNGILSRAEGGFTVQPGMVAFEGNSRQTGSLFCSYAAGALVAGKRKG
jgi:hypothetical protein